MKSLSYWVVLECGTVFYAAVVLTFESVDEILKTTQMDVTEWNFRMVLFVCKVFS